MYSWIWWYIEKPLTILGLCSKVVIRISSNGSGVGPKVYNTTLKFWYSFLERTHKLRCFSMRPSERDRDLRWLREGNVPTSLNSVLLFFYQRLKPNWKPKDKKTWEATYGAPPWIQNRYVFRRDRQCPVQSVFGIPFPTQSHTLVTWWLFLLPSCSLFSHVQFTIIFVDSASFKRWLQFYLFVYLCIFVALGSESRPHMY